MKIQGFKIGDVIMATWICNGCGFINPISANERQIVKDEGLKVVHCIKCGHKTNTDFYF